MRREAEYRSEKAEAYFDQVNETILDLLPIGAKRFLDVGCGAGANGLAIKARVPGAVVHGIEVDEAVLRQSAEVLDFGVRADLNREFPVLESDYDCVICGDILEHLIDPWGVLQRLTALLVEDGSVIASIPNIRHYKILRDLIFKGQFSYRTSGILDSTHLRFFTLHEMKRLFDRSGLQVTRVVPVMRGGNKLIGVVDAISLGRLAEFRAYQYVLVGNRPLCGSPA